MTNAPWRFPRSFRNVDKPTLYFLFLVFNFFLTYRVMLVSMFTVHELIVELAYLLFLFGYIFLRIAKRVMRQDYRLNNLEVIMAVLFFLPFIPAFSSYREWDQPFIYGLGTMREFYLLYGGLITYNLLREKKVTMKMVEKAMVTAAWMAILFFYGMSLLTDPMQFNETGFAAAHEAKGGEAYYQFQTGFMFFGSIYYPIKAFLERRYHLLIYGGIFLAYVVLFRLDRTTMAVIGFALIAFFVTKLTIKQQVRNVVRFGVPLVMVIGLAILIKPDFAKNYTMMFGEILEVASNSEEEDIDTNIRLYELDIAYRYIEKNPFFGSGKVSRQWKYGGYSYFFGYFFITDIGIIGAIFCYGIIGTAILYSQYLFALYFSLKNRLLRDDPFLVACQFGLLAISLDSLTNGYLTIYAAQAFTMSIIIYRYYEMDVLLRHKNTKLNQEETSLNIQA